jgi:hypothetical protein
MRDDLTYRQQRTLNLISESLLTGKTELAEQALNEQFPGLGGRRGPKLTMTMPDGSVADMNPSDVNDIAGAGGAGGAGGDDAGGGFLDILNDIASIPKDLTADLIGAIDDLSKIFIGINETETGLIYQNTETGQRIYKEDFSAAEKEELSGALAKRVGVFRFPSQMGTTTTNAGTNTFVALRPPM